MTAYILKPYSDRVEILSDGANYLPDGTVTGFREKVMTSPIVPLAVVGSGSVPVIDVLTDVIFVAAKAIKSVDDTLAILASSLSVIKAEGFACDGPARMADRRDIGNAGTGDVLFLDVRRCRRTGGVRTS